MPKKKKLLLIEDDIDIQENLKLFLESENYDVDTAINGEEGLSYLANQQHRPDLILLDLMMPKMNGYEFLELYRNKKSYANAPVILLSATSDIEKHTGLGEVPFVSKPINLDSLMSTIQGLCP